ncbi:hypothetical protein D5272_17400 [bacterium D16-76]|nr:hypothetical protein [bacterium D16-76]
MCGDRRRLPWGHPKNTVTTVTNRHPLEDYPPKERRNPAMPYAILRFQKRKAGGVAACERHNERKKEAYKSNPDIDVGRSKDNYHLVKPPRYTYKKEINRMVAEAGCRMRKDSVMMVETLITASPEFMNQLPPEEQMCHRENLYQIDLLNGSKNRVTEREYWAKRKGQAALDKENASQAATGEPPKQTKFETDKEKLRRTIRAALSSAVSFEDFSGKLLQQGVTVKESRGRLSYLTPDRTKPITARRLGDDFDRAAVLEALTINAQNAARAAETPLPKQEYPRSIKDRLQRNKAAINAPKQDGVQRMVDIAAKKAEGKGKGYEKWATLHNLKQMAATMSIYEESGFSSPEELEAALAAASTELHETTGKLKAVESTLREKKDLQKQLLAYIKTKPARDGLRAQKTEKARRAYREQHESEFIISESAARYFKAQGIQKLPASKALQAEIEQLTREKNTLYNEYREKKASVRELQTVKGNLDKILRREPERGKGRENER